MSVVGVASVRMSPGATSLAVGLSWSLPAPTMLVEADPAGGVLGSRFSLDDRRDLLTYGVAVRRGFEPELLFQNTTALGRAHCLLSPASPRSAERAVEMSAHTLGQTLSRYDMHTVIDLGCLSTSSLACPLAMQVDRLLLVMRPYVECMQSLLDILGMVRGWWGVPVELVLVGDRPFKASEIAEVTSVPVAAVLPFDPRVAAAYGGGQFSPRLFRRTVLFRTVQNLARDLIIAHGVGPRGPVADGPPPLPPAIVADPRPAEAKDLR